MGSVQISYTAGIEYCYAMFKTANAGGIAGQTQKKTNCLYLCILICFIKIIKNPFLKAFLYIETNIYIILPNFLRFVLLIPPSAFIFFFVLNFNLLNLIMSRKYLFFGL